MFFFVKAIVKVLFTRSILLQKSKLPCTSVLAFIFVVKKIMRYLKVRPNLMKILLLAFFLFLFLINGLF